MSFKNKFQTTIIQITKKFQKAIYKFLMLDIEYWNLFEACPL